MKPNIDGGEIRGVTPIAPASSTDVKGGIPVVFRFELAAGALARTDKTLTFPIKVIDAWLQLNGAGVANTTLTVQNTATAISSAMAASGSDKDVVRTASLDDAQQNIPAGGILAVESKTGATQPAATVYVLALRMG